MCTHLARVPGSKSYYFRRKIPLDLVPHYKKAELKKSLRTADKREAERLARIEGIRLDEEFAALRDASTAAQPPVATDTAQLAQPDLVSETASVTNYGDWMLASNVVSKRITDSFRQRVLEGDVADLASRHLLTLRARRDFAASSGFYEEYMDTVRSCLVDHEEILKTGDIDLRGAPTQPLWKSEAMRNAYVAFLKGEGPAVWSGAANTYINCSPASEADNSNSKTQTTLSSMVEKWEHERKPNGKTVNMAHRTTQRFHDYVGTISVEAITRSNVVMFKDKLLETGQSLINTKKQLVVINTLLNFARDNAIIDSNPAAGVTIRISQVERPRTSFDTTALNAIFSSPVFSEGIRPRAGAGDAAYWLPLLALFTGARLEELGQLHPSDIMQESYRDEQGKDQFSWVIRIRSSDEAGQGVKNFGSVRRIPIHSELIRLGFLLYVEKARDEKLNRIFHQLVADKFGTETAQFSKWFGRYLRTDCGVINKRMTFHSFRHTFKELCRLEEISVAETLMGHVGGNVGDKYGGDTYPLRPLVNGIKDYRVPDLDLSNLNTKA